MFRIRIGYTVWASYRHAVMPKEYHKRNDLSHFEASREVFSEAQRWWEALEALDLLQVDDVSGPKFKRNAKH